MNLPVEFLDKSKTAFHACANAAGLLKENGFEELKENLKWNVKKGGKYFVTRNGSSLIAFKIGGFFQYSRVTFRFALFQNKSESRNQERQL